MQPRTPVPLESSVRLRPDRTQTSLRTRLRFTAILFWAFVSVLWRRMRGKRIHPAWTFRFEFVRTLIRTLSSRSLRHPVTVMRQHLVPSPIHDSLRSAVQHTHAYVAGMRAELFTPVDWSEADPTLLYFHGGGYITCSPATHRDLVSRIAVASRARCIVIDYRKAPEHPFPKPIDDCEAAYRHQLESVRPQRLFLAGDSAGGGLVLATLLRAREAGLPMPAAAVLLSPWVDLERKGASIETNAPFDYLSREGLVLAVGHYLKDVDPRNPFASAIHADLTGLPPLLVQTGDAELFYSENLTFADRARAAGVDVTHEVEPGMVHVFQTFASFAPECTPAIDRIGLFVQARHIAAIEPLVYGASVA